MTKYDIKILTDFLEKRGFNKSNYKHTDLINYWKDYGMYIITVLIDRDNRGKYYLTIDISYDENNTTVHTEPILFDSIGVSSLRAIIDTYAFLIKEIYNAME